MTSAWPGAETAAVEFDSVMVEAVAVSNDVSVPEAVEVVPDTDLCIPPDAGAVWPGGLDDIAVIGCVGNGVDEG